ncbi:MAG TPA: Rieske 2Fe-2S domain-containing protein [Burkholderiales bacterium]|nr:Rieske 2Fe-2S domain-containing protein [Burkholderiales bacterium]
MLREHIPDLSKCVEPDRVRREVYTDPQIFELEMQRIHERVWIYCGHESQIPKAGDYYTLQIGRQPMLMVRGADGKISVLYNRCPHRGNMMVGDRHGNAGEFFRCSYHAWTFRHDGKLRSIPMDSAYAGTRFGKDKPDCSMKRAARVENYRGFVFASLSSEGVSLKEFLGDAIVAFDDMCDRAPEGEVEVVPNCFRVIQHSNWKIFLENQLDALHPSVVHQSTGRAAHDIEKKLAKQSGSAPLSYHMLSAFATVTIDKWDNFQTLNYPGGHSVLTGYMGLRPQDPDTVAYDKIMIKAYGQKRFEEIVGVNIHHVIVYPGLSVQSPLQQLRAVRPLSVDRTLTEIWHFRLKGAPEAIYRRSLAYYNLVNSPSTLINADDLENFWKCHQGLAADAGDWVSFGRHFGRDIEKDGHVESGPNMGTSEAPMRGQMKAWAEYMRA